MNYPYEVEMIKQKLDESKRLTPRDFLEYRDVEFETGMITNAEGSAKVKLGNSEVIAGVKCVVETPYSDTPDKGSLAVGVEMSPMADPHFETGPPSVDSIELSRVVDRGIRESGAIDFESLCIVEGEKVWMVWVDIVVINNDGNLYDACNMAALLALKDAHLPKLDKDYNIIKGEKDKKLKMNFHPLMFTFVKIGEHILLDPNRFEDDGAEARFSLAITEKSDIVAIQKGVGGSFSIEELEKIADTSKKMYKKRLSALKL